jgi:ABC-type transport system involved in multi-copper enzyme maturation permease subunit
MAEVLGDAAVGSGGVNAAGGALVKFCIAAVVLCTLFFAATIRRVSARPLDRARSAGRMTDDRTAKAQALRRIMYLWFFDPQRRSGPIAPWQNPVMVKEQRCRRFGRSNWMMRLIGAYLVLSLLLVLAATAMSKAQGVTAMLGVIAIMQVSLILLFTPSLAGGLISGERESRGWQLLQMTPMSTSTIVVGKLLGAALPLALVLLATLPAFGALILFDPSLVQMALAVLTTLALFALMAILLSAGVGSLFRHTAPATATAYTLLVAICAGTLICWLGQDAPFGRSLVEAVLLANPLAATLNLIGVPGFTQYSLIPGNWYVLIALSVASLLLLLSQTRRLSRPR